MKDKYPYEMDVSTSNTSIARDRKLHPIRSSRKLSIPNLKCHDSVARDVVATGLFACLTRETAEGRGARLPSHQADHVPLQLPLTARRGVHERDSLRD